MKQSLRPLGFSILFLGLMFTCAAVQLPELAVQPEQLFEKPLPYGPEAGLLNIEYPAGAIQPALPSGETDWGGLVFQSARTGDWEIYTAMVDGSLQQRLTDNPATDSRPSLRRGGDRIAFQSNRDGNYEIYSMNYNGSHQRRLTGGNPAHDYSPAWSPDGEKIAFVSQRDGNDEIYVMNADGGGLTRITNSPEPEYRPTWTQDGRLGWAKGCQQSPTTGSYYGGIVYLANADGSGAAELTYCRFYLSGITFSPDGKYLVYDSDTDGDGWNELTVHEIGGYSQAHFDLDQPFVDIWVGNWSPDDQWIGFSRVEYGLEGNYLVINYGYLERVRWNWMNNNFYDHARLTGSGADLWPQVERRDTHKPTSWFEGLSEYTLTEHWVDIAWSGQDTGIAGIKDYHVQYRRPGSQGWEDLVWTLFDPATSGQIYGEPGDTVYFRLRARDYAGNIEDFPANPDGDAQTTLYSYRLDGNVSDNRGLPVQEASVSLSPAALNSPQTGVDGEYAAYMVDAGSYSVSAEGDGYASLPPVSLDIQSHASFDTYLPPTSDLLPKGGFEEGWPSGWQLTGPITRTQLVDKPHSGEHALQMGFDCQTQCDQPDPSFVADTFDLAVDANNNLHLAYYSWRQSESVWYALRHPNGSWTAPVEIGAATHMRYPSIAVDGEGNVHIVWDSNSQLYYRYKPAGGEWTPAEILADLGGKEGLELEVDSSDNAHLVFLAAGGYLEYLRRPAGGAWEAAVKITIMGGGPGVDLDVGVDGSVYIIGQETDGFLAKIQLQNWYSNSFNGALAQDGSLHYFYGDLDRPPDYRRIPALATDVENSISTQVSLAADLHAPTLAFMAAMETGGITVTSRLEAWVTDAVTSTLVFSQSSGSDWTQHWVDLSAWAGDQITATFKLRQSAGEPLVNARLDSISVGEWNTPVITEVIPTKLSDYPGKTLAVLGENFLPGAEILIGNTALHTIWLDESRLEAILPVDLLPGDYSVSVRQPDGARTRAPILLRLGSDIYLPSLNR